MNIHLDMIWLIGIALLALFGGPYLGYWIARNRLSESFAKIEIKERAVRTSRIQIQRQRYQDSTSRIHQSPADPETELPQLQEELAQKNLELIIVRQDNKLEIGMLQEEIEGLKKQLNVVEGSPAVFSDITTSDVIEQETPALAEDETTDEQETHTMAEDKDFVFPNSIDEDKEEDFEQLSEEIDASAVSEPEPTDLNFHWKPAGRKKSRSRRSTIPDLDLASISSKRLPKTKLEKNFSAQNVVPSSEASSNSEPATSSGDGLPVYRSVLEHIETLPTRKRTPLQDVERNMLEGIMNLSSENFNLLDDLGYASLRKVAGLSSKEVRRLADIFEVPASDIELAWVPTARAHLNLMNQ